MKKLVKITAFALLAVMFAAASFGCIKINYPTDPTEEPTSAPTEEPALTDEPVSFDGSLPGDWYGVFAIADAEGKYAANKGVENDCALRLDIKDGGEGTAYLAVNGMGAVLNNCALSANGKEVVLKGEVGGRAVEWKLILVGEKLFLSENYGEGSDTMKIEITLMHCGAEWSGLPMPAGYDFTAEYGFGGVIEAFGGDPKALPTPEGEGVNLRFTTDEWNGVPEPVEPGFYDEGRTVSNNEVFSLVVPEGFKITRDDDYAISFSNVKEGVTKVIFYMYKSDLDPFEEILGNEHAPDTFMHFKIQDFKCYAIVYDLSEEEGGGAELFMLGMYAGNMLEVHYVIDGTAEDLCDMLGREPGYFETLVLGALLEPDNIVTD